MVRYNEPNNIPKKFKDIERRLDSVERSVVGPQLLTEKSDMRTPSAPQNLTVSSATTLDKDGNTVGTVRASWNAVTEASFGTPLEISLYELWARPTEERGVWRRLTAASDLNSEYSPLSSGASWTFRVRAIARSSTSPGEWSQEVIETIVGDTTPPPVPHMPILTTRLGVISVEWDGMPVMPSDFLHVEVAMGASPGATQVVGSLSSRGYLPVVDQPYKELRYFRFRSVDRSGNKSDWSGEDSIATKPLVDVDLLETNIDARIEENRQKAIDAFGKAEEAEGTAERAEREAEAASAWIADTGAELNTRLEGAEVELESAEGRLSEAESALGQAFPGGAFDVGERFSTTLKSTQIQYAVSISETTPPTTGWSSATPTRTPGTFVWFRTVLTYANDTTNTSNPALLTGNTGEAGEPGTPGPPGKDGQALYTWVKYAPNGNPTSGQLSDSPVGMSHMGIAYNKTSATKSNVPGDYTWSLIKGEQGDTGIPGPPGSSGQTLYTWIKYAPNGSPTSGQITDTPTASSTHIGIAYNKTSSAESPTPGDYTWSLIKGAKGDKGDKGDTGSDGLPGAAGVGLASTTIAYARSASGTTPPGSGWSANVPAVIKGQFLWTRTTWTYTNGTSETGYTSAYWANDGAPGNDGIAGKDGVGIVSTTITYAQSTSGTTAPTSGWASSPPAPVAGRYIWTRTVWGYSDLTTETGYSVGKIGDTGGKGDQGVGVDSVTPYFRQQAAGTSAPAQPSGLNPSGWATTEPAYNENMDLYRTERILYTNGTVVYTPVNKIASYAGIKEAREAARAAQEEADAARAEIDAGLNLVNNTSRTGTVDRWSPNINNTVTLAVDNVDFNGTPIKAMKYTSTGNPQLYSDFFPVDITKAYEIRLWVLDPTPSANSGSQFYFGMHAHSGSGNLPVAQVPRSSGVPTETTNAYFHNVSSTTPEWTEFIAYILPYGTDPALAVGLGKNVQRHVILTSPDTVRANIRVLNYNNAGVARDMWVAHMSVTETTVDAVRLAHEAQKRADEAHNNAGDARSAADNALNATTHNGRNLFSNSAPAGMAPYGTMWFRRASSSDGRIIGQWQQIGGSAPAADGTGGAMGSNWQPREISSEVIANLDVGKLTAGSADIKELVAKKIAADTGQFISLDVGQLTVTGQTTLDTAVANEFWARKIASEKVLANEVLIGGQSNELADIHFRNEEFLKKRLDDWSHPAISSYLWSLSNVGVSGVGRFIGQMISPGTNRFFAFDNPEDGTQVNEGETWRFVVRQRTDVGGARVAVIVRFHDGTFQTVPLSDWSGAGGWNYLSEGTYVVPQYAVALTPIVQFHDSALSARIYAGFSQFGRMVDHNLVVEGSIRAEHLDTDTFEADTGIVDKLRTNILMVGAIDNPIILADGVITADHITASTSMSAKMAEFLSVKAGHLDANEIWADDTWTGHARAEMFTAGAIPPEALAIGVDELLPDPMWENPELFDAPRGTKFRWSTSSLYRQNGQARTLYTTGGGLVASDRLYLAQAKPTSPGDMYRLVMEAQATSTSHDVVIGLEVQNTVGDKITDLFVAPPDGSEEGTALHPLNTMFKFDGTVTVPDGGFHVRPWVGPKPGDNPSSGLWYISRVSMRSVMTETVSGWTTTMTGRGVQTTDPEGMPATQIGSFENNAAVFYQNGVPVASISDEGTVYGQVGAFDQLEIDGSSLDETMRSVASDIVYDRNFPVTRRMTTRGGHSYINFDVHPGRMYEVTCRVHTRNRDNMGVWLDFHWEGTSLGNTPNVPTINSERVLNTTRYPIAETRAIPSGSYREITFTINADIWTSDGRSLAVLLAAEPFEGSGAGVVEVSNAWWTVKNVGSNRDIQKGGNYSTSGGGSSGGGSQPAPQPTPRRFTREYYATDWAAFQNVGSTSGGSRTTSVSAPMQGYTSNYSSAGRYASQIYFDYQKIMADMAGATILSAEVRLTMEHSHQGSGGIVRLHSHDRGPGQGSFTMNHHFGDPHFARGQTRWVGVMTQWWRTGAAKGIAIHSRGSNSSSYYVRVAGSGASTSKRPLLRIVAER